MTFSDTKQFWERDVSNGKTTILPFPPLHLFWKFPSDWFPVKDKSWLLLLVELRSFQHLPWLQPANPGLFYTLQGSELPSTKAVLSWNLATELHSPLQSPNHCAVPLAGVSLPTLRTRQCPSCKPYMALQLHACSQLLAPAAPHGDPLLAQ